LNRFGSWGTGKDVTGQASSVLEVKSVAMLLDRRELLPMILRELGQTQ
jgi:hypothetical protein